MVWVNIYIIKTSLSAFFIRLLLTEIEAYNVLYLNSADGKEKHKFKIRCAISSRLLRQVRELD
jgi:hypothetical protein